MDFQPLHNRLVAKGYNDDTADAKIAHDVVLKAISAAGFRENLTVKGGVVMSGITDLIRRATMDMDVDFLRYSISNASVRHFIAVLNRVSDCRIQIVGRIIELKHQDYHGKRLFLKITDGHKVSVKTKLDIGIHTWSDVRQSDFDFKIVTDASSVSLQTNPKEQIFVEKLKSLLRIGPVSTRFKDVYDMYYLRTRVRKGILRKTIQTHIFEDDKIRERNTTGIISRLERIFKDKGFLKGLHTPASAWLDVPTEEVTKTVVDFLAKLWESTDKDNPLQL